MAVPWFEHCRAALDAELHAQIVIDDVELPATTPGEAWVRGRVARVFRGSTAILGESVRVSVDVMRDGDLAAPSAKLWTNIDHLREAKVLEAFMSRDGGGWAITMSMSQTLSSTTETPAMAITEADATPPPDTSSLADRLVELLGLVLLLLFFGGGFAGLAYAAWLLLR